MMLPRRPPPQPDDLPRATTGDDQPAVPGRRPKNPSLPQADQLIDGEPERAVLDRAHRQRDELARKRTNPGIPLAIPAAPLPPLALRPTAPASALTKPTVRVATPPAGIDTTAPLAPALEPTVPPASNVDAASLELTRKRAEAAEAKLAEAERRLRVRTETDSPASFPPKVQERAKGAASAGTTLSSPPDAAIGRSVRYLLGKLWPLFVAAAGIGGGVTAVARPSTDPAKTDAVLANTESIKRELELTRKQLNGVLDREAALTVYVECLAEQQATYLEQLSPAPDKMGAAAPLKPFVDRCKNRRP